MATLLGFRTAVVTGVVALAVASPLSAERLPVRIFTTADGLPSDQLQCVRSDRRGFVWFCTAEGLVRFDGQIAVTFGRDDGLSPPGVRSFLNASGDRYFVGVDDGLFAFDAGVVASPVRFTALVRDDGQPTRGVNALAESRDRTIWCGTGDGLLHLSQAGGRTHLVEVDIGLPREIQNDRILRAVLEDERGILWVGAGSGLYAREPEGRVTRVTVAQGLPANDILDLALDGQGRLLAATREGLVLLDRKAILRRDRHVVRRVLTERDGLPALNVRSFHIEGHTLWIGTVFGIAEASLTSAGDLRVERTLIGFNAWDIATDLRGNVWMATEAGARRLSRRGFITYSTDHGLPAQRVSSLLETSRGEVCASTLGAYRREISCFDGQRFRPVRSVTIERIRDTGWGWSQLTLQDRRGGWWIPTSEGLLRFAPGPVSSLSTARPESTYTRRQGLRSDPDHQGSPHERTAPRAGDQRGRARHGVTRTPPSRSDRRWGRPRRQAMQRFSWSGWRARAREHAAPGLRAWRHGPDRVARPGSRHPHRRRCADDAPACSCGWPHRIAALTWRRLARRQTAPGVYQ